MLLVKVKEWFDQIDKVAEWAKEQGCKKMESFQDQVSPFI